MKTSLSKYLILGIIFSALLFHGCEKFLDIDPQGQLTQEAFPVTEADALLATNAVYATLREWHYNSGGYPILDIMSDDAHRGSNPNDQISTLGPYDSFDFTPAQDGLDRWWNELYKGVKRTNVVIDLVPGIAMDPELRDRYVAEASFIRGLLYFDLVRAWSGVQIVTSTEPVPNLPRSTADQVYARIIEDLENAIKYLPEKSEYNSANAGRATKGAANSLLAKVFLFKGDYASAEPLLMEVINSDEYGLEPKFIDANG